MKQRNQLKNFLLKISAIVLSWVIFLLVLQPSSTYQSVNRQFYTPFNYLQYLFTTNPVKVLSSFVQDFNHLKSVQQENQQLRINLFEVSQLQAKVVELQQDNLRLQQQLDLTETLTQTKIINANTISKEIELHNQLLIINKGESQGISLHMAVVDHNGLIGKIVETTPNTATVALLTNAQLKNQFALKVQISSSETVEAILDSYDPNTNQYLVNLLDSSSIVKVGDKVVTSGLGSIVPSGILVGEVGQIHNSPATLSVVLRVTPASDFSHLEYVSVISK